MKSITGTIWEQPEPGELPPPLPPPAPAVRAPTVLAGFCSLADQAVVSGTNFLTMLILARACSPSELGVYSLAWTVVLFLAALQGNLISIPYTVYQHRREGDDLAQYVGSTLIHQLAMSAAAVACFLVLDVVLSLGIGPESVRPAAWALLGAAPFVMLREFGRRLAFAHLAMMTALIVDLIVAVVQIAALLALWRMELLSAASAYAAMGVACALAAVCWWLSERRPMQFVRARFYADWKYNWSFGRWAAVSQFTGLALYMLPWMLAAVRGEAETGVLAACSTLVGLSNLFVLGVNNLLMPKAAQAFNHHGPWALVKVLRTAVLWFVLVLGGLCVAMYFAGNLLGSVVFGPDYAHTGSLIAVLALATFTDALGLTAGIGLWAMDRPAASFSGDLAQLVVTLSIAAWLVAPLGAMGIAVALVAGRTVGAAVRWSTLWMRMNWVKLESEAI